MLSGVLLNEGLLLGRRLHHRILQIEVPEPRILSGGRAEAPRGRSAAVCPVQLSSCGRRAVKVTTSDVSSTDLGRCQSSMNYPCFETFGITIYQVQLVGTHDATVPESDLGNNLALQVFSE